jgi:hypothetical protein
MTFMIGLHRGSAGRLQISVIAKLSWGLLYGLGFGAGMGHAFSTFQLREKPPAPVRAGV